MTLSPQRICDFAFQKEGNDTCSQIFMGDFLLWLKNSKSERYSEAFNGLKSNGWHLRQMQCLPGEERANPVTRPEHLTWCNRLQQACAWELVSTVLERWAAGRFCILKCHSCQRVDGFPSVENKLRGEPKRRETCYVGDSTCYTIVLLKRERLCYTPRILLSSKSGALLFVCI